MSVCPSGLAASRAALPEELRIDKREEQRIPYPLPERLRHLSLFISASGLAALSLAIVAIPEKRYENWLYPPAVEGKPSGIETRKAVRECTGSLCPRKRSFLMLRMRKFHLDRNAVWAIIPLVTACLSGPARAPQRPGGRKKSSYNELSFPKDINAQGRRMRPYIPSLQSLLAFEAASRHLSFTRAAQELHLTQTAISHQIKTLEERLGTKLFVRRRNVLALTPAAREYLQSVNEAISLLSIATDRTRKKQTSTVLTVTCLPTYAVKCLIPALPEFQRAHPDITLHLATSNTFDAFERNSYDVAIRYGSGHWASMRTDRLHDEEFFPVCAPSLLREAGSFSSVAEGLSRMRQIRTYFYSMYQDDWPAWLEAAVQGPVEFAGEAVFHLQLTSLEAAIDGLGIAIGRTPLVDADLASGRLVQPFALRVPSNSAYFVTSPVNKAKLKKVEVFREWALDRLGNGAGSTANPPHSAELTQSARTVERRADTCPIPAAR